MEGRGFLSERGRRKEGQEKAESHSRTISHDC
jgi:hypothetical protein